VTIGRGNVFHPECHIILDASNLSPSVLNTLDFRIGDNNIFEECSILTFHLNESTTLLMGSYNLMATKSQVETSRVGNGNIFQPACHIQIPTIKNGNIFSPMCSLSIKEDANIQEMVFYVMRKTSQASPACKFRDHVHGTKKNIAENSTLLSAVKNIVQANHPIMMATPGNR